MYSWFALWALWADRALWPSVPLWPLWADETLRSLQSRLSLWSLGTGRPLWTLDTCLSLRALRTRSALWASLAMWTLRTGFPCQALDPLLALWSFGPGGTLWARRPSQAVGSWVALGALRTANTLRTLRTRLSPRTCRAGNNRLARPHGVTVEKMLCDIFPQDHDRLALVADRYFPGREFFGRIVLRTGAASDTDRRHQATDQARQHTAARLRGRHSP